MQQVGPETFPVFDGFPTAMTDGRFGYIVGGFQPGMKPEMV